MQLGYLSLLALLSDWICFSDAAAPVPFEAAYGHDPAVLIDLFLATNVMSCFFVTDAVQKYGLAKTIKGAGCLMAGGCFMKSGIPFVTGFVPYEWLVAGTIMVGIAQPYFQCTPPLLSAKWFGKSERATATAIALNANQIGIATAFLVGGSMATSTHGIENYFALITILTTVVAAGCAFQFEEKPATPPSSSELQKMSNKEEDPTFFESAKKLFKTKGFGQPLVAFIASISITNVVGAFIAEVMERGGITNQLHVDLAGAGFELSILLGGILVGGYVDRTKEYKRTTLITLALTTFCLIPLGLTEHAIGQEPVLLLIALFGLGISAGPIQPVNAELAVEVSYPCDETAVESTQQIFGNLVRALLVPLAAFAMKRDFELFPKMALESDIRGDVIILCAIAAVTGAIYSTFGTPLKRSLLDCESDGNCETGLDLMVSVRRLEFVGLEELLNSNSDI